MKIKKIFLSITVFSAFVLLASGSVDEDPSSSSSTSSGNSLPSGGPDICDCTQNAMNVGTYLYDESLQTRCENYSNRLTETQKQQRVSEAFNRGCL